MQSVQLSIPKPCHENWDKMTPTQQGRFCNACAKQVVDFTNMSDGEVLNFFLKNKEENVCGRTLPQQLDRVLEAPKPIVPSKLWYWKYAAAGLLFFSKADGLQAQSVIPYTPQEINTLNNGLKGRVGQITVTSTKIISGKITDTEGKEIPFASVKIKGTNRGVSSDANGEYSIKVDNGKDILQVSAIGYEMYELNLKNDNKSNVSLVKSKHSLKGDVVVVGYVGRISVEDKMPLINIQQKNVAIIKVKDSISGKLIENAKLFIKENYNSFDTIQLNDGTHKIMKIKEDDVYIIQASKDGYISKAIALTNENFNKRKGVFEIELKKKNETPQKINVQQVNSLAISTNDITHNRTIGAMRCVTKNEAPLLLIDGKIVTLEMINSVTSANVENVTTLKKSEAIAIYGSQGADGAILITTKKKHPTKDSLPISNYKLMKEVVVNSIIDKRVGKITTTGVMTVISGEMQSTLVCTTEGKNVKSDTLKQKILNLFSPIKIYPNPAQKGQAINISFNNKYNSYTMQVVNALGVVVLYQRRQNSFREAGASFKKITEQIIISPQWSSGYYLINILNEQGKVVAKDGFLVL